MDGEIKYIIAKNYINYEPRKLGKWLLYQVGRRYCAAGSTVQPHRHGELLELTVVTKGVGSVTADGESVTVRTGDIHVSLPGDMHSIVSDKDEPLCYDFIAFWAKGDTEERMTDTVAYCKATGKRLLRDARISRLLTYAIDETSDEGGGAAEVLARLLELIYTYLLRSLRAGGVSDERTVSEATQICYRVMSYIDKNVFSIRLLSEVAEAMSYNYAYLSMLFKRTTGRAIMDYYTERRLAAADALLCSGMRVTDVAARLGYSSPYTFSRAYRLKFGYPPSHAKLRRNNPSGE